MLDLKNLSPQEQAELEIIRGMFHHPNVRQGASLLEEILFTHPALRDAFKLLSNAREIHHLDEITLENLAQELNLDIDIPSIVGSQAPSLDALGNHYKTVRDLGSKSAYLRLNEEMNKKVQAGEDHSKLMQEHLLRIRDIEIASLPEMPPSPTMKDRVHRAINQVEEYHERIKKLGSPCTGIPTGFMDIDKITNGLHPGIILLASRPSVNLPNFALNIALEVSKGNRVMYVSCNQSADYLTLRALHMRARVSIRNTQEGFLAERDFPKLTAAAGFLDQKANLQFYDNLHTAQEIYKQASWERAKKDLKLLIINSFQDIIPPTRDYRNKEIAALETASQIERMVSQFNIPIIVLSKVGKEPDRKARDKRPYIGDIRDFGALEYSASPIIILHRLPFEDEDYEIRKEEIREKGVFSENVSPINAYIERNSFGPSGEVALSYFGESGNFESAAKVSAED